MCLFEGSPWFVVSKGNQKTTMCRRSLKKKPPLMSIAHRCFSKSETLHQIKNSLFPCDSLRTPVRKASKTILRSLARHGACACARWEAPSVRRSTRSWPEARPSEPRGLWGWHGVTICSVPACAHAMSVLDDSSISHASREACSSFFWFKRNIYCRSPLRGTCLLSLFCRYS